MGIDFNDLAAAHGADAVREAIALALTKPLATAPEWSEAALAEDFVSVHSKSLRYCATWKTWMIWDGCRWKADDTNLVFDQAREICVKNAAAAHGHKIDLTLAKASTSKAVLTFASAMRPIAVSADEWDKDLFLLNTPGGEIDLRSGDLRLHRPESYCTKLAGAAPNGDCPRWQQFLHEACGGDHAVAEYLQRLVGYWLTGDTREHALIFLYGPGGNGKGVFIHIIETLLGDYTKGANIETFTESKNERHPTDLAGLRGARFVTVPETEAGRYWAASKIKSLTGGDRVTARFMRGDFFDYTPQFKLIIVGNHKPALRSVEPAMRRRLHIVPFLHKPPVVDHELEAKLREELPGIMAWAIQGCLKWQHDGLTKPESVIAATDEYFDAEDTIGEWLEARTVKSPDTFSSTEDLFTDWKEFAKRIGIEAGKAKDLVQDLARRGFRNGRRRNGTGSNVRGFLDVMLTGHPFAEPEAGWADPL